MHLTEDQKTFIEGLDQNRHYKVEGRNYTHVAPSMMTPSDVEQLMTMAQSQIDITEDSILHAGQMIL